MTTTDVGLRRLFDPSSVAVVGASASPGKAGHAMLQAVRASPADVVAINARGAEIDGVPTYRALADAVQPIDLALLCVPAAAVPDALRDGAAAGIGAAVICSGGMAESGDDGARLQDEALLVARDAGIRLLGPNTSGFINPTAGLSASFVEGAGEIPAGNVAVVAQSGGVNHHLSFALSRAGMGLRLGVGLGNAADVGVADLLDHLAQDPGTDVVVLALEGVRDGRALLDALRRITPRKPVVVLKAGTDESNAFAQSHTGALAGDGAVASAVLRQGGAVVVNSTSDLIDVARALVAGRMPPTRTPGVAVVSGQAGPALILVDELARAGVALPTLGEPTRARLAELLPPLTYQRNPVDTGRPGPTFADVVVTTAADPAVDAVVVYALHEPGAIDLAVTLRDVRGRVDVPVLLATGGRGDDLARTDEALAGADVPIFRSPEAAARAAAGLAQDAAARARVAIPAPDADVPAPGAPLTAVAGTLSEDASKALLADLGFRVPQREVHARRGDAYGALERLRTPLVVKVVDEAITHKSDVGGVHVGVGDRQALDEALDAIDAIPGDASDRRYLLEEQAGPGVELLVGGLRDVGFGPVVALGLGGVAAEALGDVTFRAAPLRHADAVEMIDELRAQRLLDGFRGLPAVDRDELATLLVRAGDLMAGPAAVRELDVNPVRATAAGLLALDGLVVGG